MNACRSAARLNEPAEDEGDVERVRVRYEEMSSQEDEVNNEESEEQREVESDQTDDGEDDAAGESYVTISVNDTNN